MVRGVAGFLLAVAVLWAQNDCSHCDRKYDNAAFMIGKDRAISVGGDRALMINKPENLSVIAYNRFLNLYLIQSKDRKNLVEFKYPFTEKQMTLFNEKGFKDVELIKRQCGLRSFGEIDQKVKDFSILSGMCCKSFGLVSTNGKVIDSEYIKDFLKRQDALYGDIGLRFDDKMRVEYIDPYIAPQIEKGAKIQGFETLRDLEDRILFAKPGSSVKLRYEDSSGKIRTTHFSVKQRFGGGMVSDSFLERFGILFSDDLRIVWINPESKARKAGLKVGDLLKNIDLHEVSTPEEVKTFLTDTPKDRYNYMWERKGFYFFVAL